MSETDHVDEATNAAHDPDVLRAAEPEPAVAEALEEAEAKLPEGPAHVQAAPPVQNKARVAAQAAKSTTGRFFGTGVNLVRVMAGTALLGMGAAGGVHAGLRALAQPGANFPVEALIAAGMGIGGLVTMPAPPKRIQRKLLGPIMSVLAGVPVTAAVGAMAMWGANNYLPSGKWGPLTPDEKEHFLQLGQHAMREIGITTKAEALRWAAALPLSWAALYGMQLWRTYGKPWVMKGYDQEDVMTMKADLLLGHKFETGEPIIIKESDRFMHTIVQGPTGSGKTATGLSPGIVQDLRNPRVGITAIEPKGDWINGDGARQGIVQWAAHYGRNCYKVDPADEHTDVVNPLHGDRHMVAEVNTVALKVLFGSEQNFFATAQEALLKKVVYLLKWLKGDDLTYWDLHRAIRDFGLLVKMASDLDNRLTYWREQAAKAGGVWPNGLKDDDIMEAEDLLRWFRLETQGEKGEKLQEVTLGLRVQLDNLMNNSYFRRCVVPPPEPFRDEEGNIIGGRVIDIDKHMATGSVLAVSTNDGLLAEYSKVLGRMIITQFQYAASRRFQQAPELRGPHMIWIDEAGTYLTSAWGEFQTKARGFNIGIILALQDLQQLERVERGFTGVIVGQCRTRLLYGGLPPNDVKYWVSAFGTKAVADQSISESERYTSSEYTGVLGPIGMKQVNQSRSTRTVDKERVSFNELWELPRGKIVLQKIEGGSIEVPLFARVNIVKELPPPIAVDGGQTYDPLAGLAISTGPLLPPVPNAVAGGDVGQTPIRPPEGKGKYTPRDNRRDAQTPPPAKDGKPRSITEKLGVQPKGETDPPGQSQTPAGDKPTSGKPSDGEEIKPAPDVPELELLVKQQEEAHRDQQVATRGELDPGADQVNKQKAETKDTDEASTGTPPATTSATAPPPVTQRPTSELKTAPAVQPTLSSKEREAPVAPAQPPRPVQPPAEQLAVDQIPAQAPSPKPAQPAADTKTPVAIDPKPKDGHGREPRPDKSNPDGGSGRGGQMTLFPVVPPKTEGKGGGRPRQETPEDPAPRPPAPPVPKLGEVVVQPTIENIEKMQADDPAVAAESHIVRVFRHEVPD